MKLLIAVAFALAAAPALASDLPRTSGDWGDHKGSSDGGSIFGNGKTIFDDLANWVGGDLTAAETLAVQNPNLQDWTGYACWKAAENFVSVLKAHPIPLTLKAATDAEALRLATSAAKSLCQTSACQTVSADLLGGIAQMGIGLPPPITLQTLCAKIPTVTLGVAPTPLPVIPGAPTPTPVPSATGN